MYVVNSRKIGNILFHREDVMEAFVVVGTEGRAWYFGEEKVAQNAWKWISVIELKNDGFGAKLDYI